VPDDCPVLSGYRGFFPKGGFAVSGRSLVGGRLLLKRSGWRSLLDLVVKERGVWAVAQGYGVRLEAETQFARRSIIGFGLAETNHLL
jgi:hypothetical protein